MKRKSYKPVEDVVVDVLKNKFTDDDDVVFNAVYMPLMEELLYVVFK